MCSNGQESVDSIIFVRTCAIICSIPKVDRLADDTGAIAGAGFAPAIGLTPPGATAVKSFLIRYRLQNASPEEWHKDVAEFIAALDNDPALKGKISYRCMKIRDSADYLHLATAADDQTIKTLQQSPFFAGYTEKTRRAAGGSVDVVPIEIVAETRSKA